MGGIVILILSLRWRRSRPCSAARSCGCERATRRFEVLSRIAQVSDRGGSLQETLDSICEILVPEFADFCMIDLIKSDRVERIAVRVGPGGGQRAVEGLAGRMPSLPPDDERRAPSGPIAPRFFERMTDADLRELAHDEEDLEFLRSLGVARRSPSPCRRAAKLTGALTSASPGRGAATRREDVEFAWILSGRVALALDNAGLFADLERAEQARAEIAETLQRGLLPPPLPHIPAGRSRRSYRPAGAENEVGGDFYDAFRRAGRLDAGDRRRHRPRRPRRLDHRPGPLHAAHRRGPHRRSAGRPLDPQPGPARPRRLGALQRRRADVSARTLRSRCGSRSPATRRRCWSTARR